MRQPGAFILVSGDQASVQVASLVFTPPTFGNVDRYSTQLHGLAILVEFNPPPTPDPSHRRIRQHHSIFRFILAVAFERLADRPA
jgi:hypothetical protein